MILGWPFNTHWQQRQNPNSLIAEQPHTTLYTSMRRIHYVEWCLLQFACQDRPATTNVVDFWCRLPSLTGQFWSSIALLYWSFYLTSNVLRLVRRTCERYMCDSMQNHYYWRPSVNGVYKSKTDCCESSRDSSADKHQLSPTTSSGKQRIEVCPHGRSESN